MEYLYFLIVTPVFLLLLFYHLMMDQISDKKNKEENWVEEISLQEAMKKLAPREQHIIDLRFYEGKTQMEVADEIGISQAQVSRLEKHALKTMKHYLR